MAWDFAHLLSHGFKHRPRLGLEFCCSCRACLSAYVARGKLSNERFIRRDYERKELREAEAIVMVMGVEGQRMITPGYMIAVELTFPDRVGVITRNVQMMASIALFGDPQSAPLCQFAPHNLNLIAVPVTVGSVIEGMEVIVIIFPISKAVIPLSHRVSIGCERCAGDNQNIEHTNQKPQSPWPRSHTLHSSGILSAMLALGLSIPVIGPSSPNRRDPEKSLWLVGFLGIA